MTGAACAAGFLRGIASAAWPPAWEIDIMKNKVSFKEQLKSIIKGTSVYKKEQRVLAIAVLCFVVCGASLPLVKDSDALAGILPESSGDYGLYYDDGSLESGLAGDELNGGAAADADGGSALGSGDNGESVTAESENGASDSQGSSAPDGYQGSGTTGSSGVVSGSAGSAGGAGSAGSGSSSGSGTGGSQSSGAGSSSAGWGSSQGGHSSSGSTGSSGSSSSSGAGGAGSSQGSSTGDDKVWVPPVYETIHHEAVYEKVRVYVCTYCQAEFASAGEFQVHKDANGG